ncbi:BTAD domain-containing putative transcriptional regulator [Plantactinospora siamensis]|uniref:BTAD domain-containing putative transcriptional regulator n=1 Tax=Plantactinospora siamensis TaxID=555372 RepID=A0ABV6NWM9_9ACTN
MQFRILGPLEILADGVELTPTTPKLRQVLALLLVQHGKLVQTDEFVDELWGDDPPSSALATLQTYIYKLRKLLSAEPSQGGEGLLRTRANGYGLYLSGQELDLCGFGRLVEQARELHERGEHSETATLLNSALSLWRGAALSDVVQGNVLRAEAARLEEWRLQALEMRVDAELCLGRHRELLVGLTSLAAEHPLHEGFQAKLMLALHRSGRRYEALSLYNRVCELLDGELGLEPSPELARLHRTLLAAPESGAGDPEHILVGPGDRPFPTPAQLPPGIPDLTGRDEAVARIELQVLGSVGESRSTSVVTVVGGPGVGKTTLAVHAAHRLAVHFPAGQLFVDLGSGTGSPADPHLVLDRLLRALGVPPQRVPATTEERGQLLRSVTAGRRLLLVLDDAASDRQVQALLPGAGGPAVLVTGQRLTIPAAGERIVLDRLSRHDGVSLLTRMIGAERVAAEPAAAARIVELCGGLPLALRIVGTRLAVIWRWSLSWAADHLADSGNRLGLLRYADLDVRASFDAALARLGETERAAAVLLGSLPGRDFGVDEAARLLGLRPDGAETLLTGLVDAFLLRPVGRHGSGLRYRIDELLHLYVQARLDELVHDRPTGPEPSLPNGGVLLFDSGVAGLIRARRISALPDRRDARDASRHAADRWDRWPEDAGGSEYPFTGRIAG